MGEPTRVLCVDNDATILDALSRLFPDRDLRLLRAGNGEEALGIVRGESVAVIVSDSLLPGMRGVELLSQVRDLSPDTVRVLLTGHADLPAAIGSTGERCPASLRSRGWTRRSSAPSRRGYGDTRRFAPCATWTKPACVRSPRRSN
jgi:CheY-like chemotaxis protein